MHRLRNAATTSLLFILLVAGCSAPETPTSQATRVTVKVIEACTDGTSTLLQIETAVTAEEWASVSSQFPNPQTVFFETAVNLMEDGAQFSSTSSGSRGGPIVDELGHFTVITQEFLFPGTPSPGARMSIDAEVSYSNNLEVIPVPGKFHVEFTVDECE